MYKSNAKTVVITGCSSGFGRQVSEQLARRGDRVFATMRGTEGKNAKIAAEMRQLAVAEKINLQVLELDVTSSVSVDAAAAIIINECGAPDVVINNAGQMYIGFTESFSADELSRQLDVNVVGVHRVNRAFLPAMRQQGRGLFINISSVAGRLSAPFFGVYHASKWALEGYSLALRGELASSGVDVVLVEPGPFTTELFSSSPQPQDIDGRVASYPLMARQTLDNLAQTFEAMLKDPTLPTDPGLVVDRIITLIEMSAGNRPFRSVVGLDFGVTKQNADAVPFDAAVLEAFGMTEFATLKPSEFQ
ncbi:SDR family oxidoreductase [Arsukibacterium sp.]|uniref:SDR family oxidoreductase n=1 Tax=Arsukibacterium sp. TaxID=1977258 RepID=UPI002FDB741A